jgi:putative heme-binding domain-containing protein
LQESFRKLDPALVDRIMACEDFHARAAAVHSVSNEIERFPNLIPFFARAIADTHPRVRLEAVRGLSYIKTAEAAEMAISVADQPLDYWVDYTLEHALQAFKPITDEAEKNGTFLAKASDKVKEHFKAYKLSTGPGGKAVAPLKIAEDTSASQSEREKAVKTLAEIKGGKADRGPAVFSRVCAACHQVGDIGKEFGPKLDNVGGLYKRDEIIKHILWPNEKIAKGYQTVQVLTLDGDTFTGFILKETETVLLLGTANGKTEEVSKKDIDIRKEMNASSMPEGLIKTIAPSEFLDLLEYLVVQRKADAKP